MFKHWSLHWQYLPSNRLSHGTLKRTEVLVITEYWRCEKNKILFIIHLYTNSIALYFTLLKQHIKIFVLFKSPNNSPTCFGQFLTILREILIFFTSVTKDKLFRFVEACLLYLLCFVLILRTVPSLVDAVLDFISLLFYTLVSWLNWLVLLLSDRVSSVHCLGWWLLCGTKENW